MASALGAGFSGIGNAIQDIIQFKLTKQADDEQKALIAQRDAEDKRRWDLSQDQIAEQNRVAARAVAYRTRRDELTDERYDKGVRESEVERYFANAPPGMQLPEGMAESAQEFPGFESQYRTFLGVGPPTKEGVRPPDTLRTVETADQLNDRLDREERSREARATAKFRDDSLAAGVARDKAIAKYRDATLVLKQADIDARNTLATANTTIADRKDAEAVIAKSRKEGEEVLAEFFEKAWDDRPEAPELPTDIGTAQYTEQLRAWQNTWRPHFGGTRYESRFGVDLTSNNTTAIDAAAATMPSLTGEGMFDQETPPHPLSRGLNVPAVNPPALTPETFLPGPSPEPEGLSPEELAIIRDRIFSSYRPGPPPDERDRILAGARNPTKTFR